MTGQSTQDNRKNRPTRSLSEILGKVLEPVIARRTGMKLELLASWKDLVGEEFASTTRPEKIDWPRRAHEDDPFQPATLVVACEPASALFFQHELAPILERTNRYFGFEAIKRIRILQKPVSVQTTSDAPIIPNLTAEDEMRLGEILTDITDPELRDALSRLGRGVISRKKFTK